MRQRHGKDDGGTDRGRHWQKNRDSLEIRTRPNIHNAFLLCSSDLLPRYVWTGESPAVLSFETGQCSFLAATPMNIDLQTSDFDVCIKLMHTVC